MAEKPKDNKAAAPSVEEKTIEPKHPITTLKKDESSVVVPKHDITTETEDGRQIVVARGGTEVSREQLARFGVDENGKKLKAEGGDA